MAAAVEPCVDGLKMHHSVCMSRWGRWKCETGKWSTRKLSAGTCGKTNYACA